MSDALEALEWLCSYALMTDEETNEMYSTEPPGTFSRDWDRNVNAIRAALEQGEAVATVSSFPIGDGGPRLKHLSVHEEIENLPDGTKLYAAPPSTAEQCPDCRWAGHAHCAHPDECGGMSSTPSTAEVKAQATELALWLVMDEWEANLDDWTAEGIKNTLLSEAKRLREEG